MDPAEQGRAPPLQSIPTVSAYPVKEEVTSRVLPVIQGVENEPGPPGVESALRVGFPHSLVPEWNWLQK